MDSSSVLALVNACYVNIFCMHARHSAIHVNVTQTQLAVDATPQLLLLQKNIDTNLLDDSKVVAIFSGQAARPIWPVTDRIW